MDPNSHKVLLFKVVLSPVWPEYWVPRADCWDAVGRWCFCSKSVQVSAPLHTQPFPSPLNLLSPPSLPFLHGATGIAFCYWLWWAASPFPGPTVTGSSLVVDQLRCHLLVLQPVATCMGVTPHEELPRSLMPHFCGLKSISFRWKIRKIHTRNLLLFESCLLQFNEGTAVDLYLCLLTWDVFSKSQQIHAAKTTHSP